MPNTNSFLLHLIPNQADHDQTPERLVALMQSLVLSDREPLALEIAGTAKERRFLLRTSSSQAQHHVLAQIRARLPQIRIQALPKQEDPLHLHSDEQMAALELCPGQAYYFPLRNEAFPGEERQVDDLADPILGVLAALDRLPVGTRMISQLALVPARPSWAKHSQRKAVEHALEPERARERRQQVRGPSLSLLGLLAAALVFVLYLHQTGQQRMLANLVHTLKTLIAGKQATSEALLLLVGLMGVALGLLLFLWLIRRLFRHVFASPLYDQNLVRRKTMRQAYRVRLRCYAIGPGVKPPTGTKTTSHSTGIQRFVAAQMEIWRQRQGLRALLNRLLAAYRQFHLAAGAGNYFVPRRIWFPQRTCTSWTRGLSWSRHLIDAETIAALWHLPPSSTLSSLSHLTHRWERSRLLSPDLARLVAHMEPIGISEHAGHRLGFAWPPECLEHHALLAGKSGEGKSTLIERLATLAMQRGGLVLIDPHGDLAEGVLRLVPTHRCDDVVWIDLADPAYAVGLNPLDVRLGRSRDTTVSHLITALKAIWHDAWGPRMENAFEFSLRTLFEANRRLCVQGLEHQQYTLLDVMSILTSESFCHALLSHVEDDFILRWWHTYYDPLSLTQQRDIINPVISKTAKFEHLIARRIIGQSRSTVDVARLIAEEKIILVKLAKGVVGEDIALVLGATILNLIQGALEAQGSLPMAERKQMPIFVDEFQTLLGVDWGALAELRKYGAAFYLATQSLEYLHREETELLFTLLANIKHIVAFHLSAADSTLLAPELSVESEDIVHLPPHTAYARLTVGATRHPPFSLRLFPPETGDTDLATRLKEVSQQRYGTPIAHVDQALFEMRSRVHGLLPATEKTEEHAAIPTGERHLARQHGGYRGKRRRSAPRQDGTNDPGSIEPMNWRETADLEKLDAAEPCEEENREIR